MQSSITMTQREGGLEEGMVKMECNASVIPFLQPKKELGKSKNEQSEVFRSSQWHIFCTVIDNYGDIGTTWRLARQLTHEHQQQVTLFVDDLNALAPLAPETDTTAICQTLHGITVQHWTNALPDIQPAPVVIEAFACTLPERYRAEMVKNGSKCINLEYFSCEDWVAGCHGLPSYQSDGLKKWFFFPGISAQTGGLLREKNLLAEKNAFCANPQAQNDWCHQWQIPIPQANSLKLSLFGYENNALPDCLAQLSEQPHLVDAYCPAGKLRSSAQPLFPTQSLETGTTLTLGKLRLHLIPFLPQDQFDRLLWLCDLNFVRGEESLTRAIWAGKPFVWHIYPTDDGAHWDKLNAFLDEYAMPPTLAQLNQEWNRQKLSADTLQNCLNNNPQLTQLSRNKVHQLSQQDDLCSQLIAFVQNK
jgi:uncharacterized repeat protein (TIGR03837 family)